MKFQALFLSGDRDNYIKIWRERSYLEDAKFDVNFRNIGNKFRDIGTPYDFGSIMHYDPFAFAIKEMNLPVITKPDGSPITLTKTDTFSKIDIEEINYVYTCDLGGL